MGEILTKEQIQVKADELTTKYNRKVKPVQFIVPDTKEQIIGYIKKPDRELVRMAMDLMRGDKSSEAGKIILQSCLCEESDSRISSEDPNFDEIVLGAEAACLSLVTFYVDQQKKR